MLDDAIAIAGRYAFGQLDHRARDLLDPRHVTITLRNGGGASGAGAGGTITTS
jgi:hypothetical protein